MSGASHNRRQGRLVGAPQDFLALGRDDEEHGAQLMCSSPRPVTGGLTSVTWTRDLQVGIMFKDGMVDNLLTGEA